MFEVLPGLYLGSIAQLEAFEPTPTDLIVNCTKDLRYDRPGTMHRIPVDDDGSAEACRAMLLHMHSAVPAIEEALRSGRRVLVHCKQGQQRSACVVAAVVMFRLRMSATEAVAFVRGRKMDAFFFQANFLPSLLKFEPHVSSQPDNQFS